MALTHTQIKNALPKGKTYRLYDSGGLLLEIRPNGGKYWRWKYYYHRKEKRMSLDVFPAISLKEARLARDEAKLRLAKGIDPIEERKSNKQRQHELVAHSFEAVANEWFLSQKSDLSESYKTRLWRSLEKDIFPLLGNRPISMITGPDLLKALLNIQDRDAKDTAH